jgi:hypothetical protein
MIGFSFHDRQGKSAARASERKRGRFIICIKYDDADNSRFRLALFKAMAKEAS